MTTHQVVLPRVRTHQTRRRSLAEAQHPHRLLSQAGTRALLPPILVDLHPLHPPIQVDLHPLQTITPVGLHLLQTSTPVGRHLLQTITQMRRALLLRPRATTTRRVLRLPQSPTILGGQVSLRLRVGQPHLPVMIILIRDLIVKTLCRISAHIRVEVHHL